MTPITTPDRTITQINTQGITEKIWMYLIDALHVTASQTAQ
jgi:hypothetical protein